MTSSRSPSEIELLLSRARAGCPDSLGLVLEAHRTYLAVMAGAAIRPALRAKVGASDLVQQTLLEAQRDIGRLQSSKEDGFRAWLGTILRNKAVNLYRHYCGTSKRDVGREVSLSGTSRAEETGLEANSPTPSSAAGQRESLQLLQTALEGMPSPYREVIEWRNLERLPFTEIGRRLGTNENAAQKTWARAIRALRDQMRPNL